MGRHSGVRSRRWRLIDDYDLRFAGAWRGIDDHDLRLRLRRRGLDDHHTRFRRWLLAIDYDDLRLAWRWRRGFDDHDRRLGRRGRLLDDDHAGLGRWRGLFDDDHARLGRWRRWGTMTRMPVMNDAAGGERQRCGQSKKFEYVFHTVSSLHVANRDMGARSQAGAADAKLSRCHILDRLLRAEGRDALARVRPTCRPTVPVRGERRAVKSAKETWCR